MFRRMDMTVLIVAVAALLIGVALGWFAGSRPAADWKARHGERDGQCLHADFRLSIAVPRNLGLYRQGTALASRTSPCIQGEARLSGQFGTATLGSSVKGSMPNSGYISVG